MTATPSSTATGPTCWSCWPRPEDGLRGDFYAVIPIHQPGRIWDKILSALSPARWAKAFAGWVIEGVHGTLCGVVERASGEDADNCRGG